MPWGIPVEDWACRLVAIRPIYAAGATIWASAFATWRLALGSDWVACSPWKMALQRIRIRLLSDVAQPHRRLVRWREASPVKGREHRPPVQTLSERSLDAWRPNALTWAEVIGPHSVGPRGQNNPLLNGDPLSPHRIMCRGVMPNTALTGAAPLS